MRQTTWRPSFGRWYDRYYLDKRSLARSVANNIDLRLIRVFDEILRTGSLVETAGVVGVSPPAVSLALARLRRLFNDPLFVRTAEGMRPTPHARELAPILQGALVSMQMALGSHVVFDPRSSTRCFRISMTDIGHFVLLPTLLKALREAAPSVSVETVGTGTLLAEQMQKGEVDLAVGFMPQLEAGFYQQRLFSDQFVCVARAASNVGTSGLSLKSFAACEHLVVSTSGTGHYIVDRALDAAKIDRRIVLRIPTFLGVAPIIEQSDLLCILPERAGRLMCVSSKIKTFALPFTIPPYAVKQHWHERSARDPGNQWLRQLLAKLFTNDDGARDRAAGPAAGKKPGATSTAARHGTLAGTAVPATRNAARRR